MNATAEQQNFETYEREMIDPLRGLDLTPVESYVASLLLSATAAKPIDNAAIKSAICETFKCATNARTVKTIIRGLRKNRSFPIISSRRPPHGYWWCQSAEEMEEFIRVFRSQAIDELHTLGRIVRENFPALAGQLRLEPQVEHGEER